MARSPSLSCAALIVDVVGSRTHRDRAGLHDRLVAAFEQTREEFPALRAPGVTAGDEFQATYARLGDAIGVAFAVRLALAPEVEVRAGLGYGEVTDLSDEAGASDGPAWWTARDAIVDVEERAARAATKHARFSYRTDDQTAPPPAAVDPALACLDQLLGPLDERSWRLLRGLVDDAPSSSWPPSSASAPPPRRNGCAATASRWPQRRSAGCARCRDARGYRRVSDLAPTLAPCLTSSCSPRSACSRPWAADR
ncbi:SatD family protein [Barrientosiimonas endolithica]|nr:SatD family protein [Barrientosiimonas endolithica]